MATADQIRNRPIVVPIPGTGLSITCRKPDPIELISSGVLPLPVYVGVLEVVASWKRMGLAEAGESLTKSLRDQASAWGDFIDRWVCAAAVEPKLVLTEEESLQDPATLWVDELDVDVKLEIFRKTGSRLRSTRLEVAVTEFRRQTPAGVADRPDGAPVRDPALVAAGDSGSEFRA